MIVIDPIIPSSACDAFRTDELSAGVLWAVDGCEIQLLRRCHVVMIVCFCAVADGTLLCSKVFLAHCCVRMCWTVATVYQYPQIWLRSLIYHKLYHMVLFWLFLCPSEGNLKSDLVEKEVFEVSSCMSVAQWSRTIP